MMTDLHHCEDSWPFYPAWHCGEKKQPPCHGVSFDGLYCLNILPYIPSAKTSYLWVCNPKNTKVHISTLYTHMHAHKHKLKKPITARSNTALAATWLPACFAPRISCGEGSWDLPDVNKPQLIEQTESTTLTRETEWDRAEESNRTLVEEGERVIRERQ